MIRTGLFLGISNTSIALIGLMRNVLIARLISVEDFGIASTFAMTMALVEMTSNIALDRLIVQAKDGERPALQSTAQSIQIFRGVLGTAILFLIAEPLSELFGAPETAWAYQILSLVPLLRGLAHLDMFRFQRKMSFTPSILVEFSAQSASTIAAIILAVWLDDYRAMLFAIIFQQITFTIMSHVAAERSYHLSWDREIVQRIISFGWPLLLNGLLMFGTFHGDRIIVGSLIGMTELGWFSAAFTVIFIPTLVVAKTIQNFFLPQLSGAQDDDTKFHTLTIVTLQSSFLITIFIVILYSIFGKFALITLYGPKYEPAVELVIWLSVMQGVRMARQGPSVIATAKARTVDPMFANIVRVLVLPVAWFAVSKGGDLASIIAFAIAGECLAFALGTYLLIYRKSITPRDLISSIFPLIFISGFIFFNIYYFNEHETSFQSHFLLLPLYVPLSLYFMPELTKWFRSQFIVD